MDGKVLKSIDVPELLQVAASSSLGLAAFVILGIGVLAFSFFRNESGTIKVGIFLFTTIVFVGVFATAFQSAKNEALAVPLRPSYAGGEVGKPMAQQAPAPATLPPGHELPGEPANKTPDSSACHPVQKSMGSGFNTRFEIVQVCE